MLYVARTFLILHAEQATDRPTAFQTAKLVQGERNAKFNTLVFYFKASFSVFLAWALLPTSQ